MEVQKTIKSPQRVVTKHEIQCLTYQNFGDKCFGREKVCLDVVLDLNF